MAWHSTSMAGSTKAIQSQVQSGHKFCIVWKADATGKNLDFVCFTFVVWNLHII